MILGMKTALAAIGALFSLKEMVGKASDNIDPELISSNGSITDFLAPLVIEPTFIVSSEIKHSEAHDDIMNLNLNMFTSLISNAFMKVMNVHDVDIKTALAIMSSKRHGLGTTMHGKLTSGFEGEDITDVDIAEMANQLMNYNTKYTYEDTTFGNEASMDEKDRKGSKLPDFIGKEFNLSFENKAGKTINLPITIRARVFYIEEDELRDYISLDSKVDGKESRKHKYASNQISAAEYYFSIDMLTGYSRKLMRGKSGAIEELERRKRDAMANNDKTPFGFGGSYGSLIMSSRYKSVLDMIIRGHIDDVNDKDKFLRSIASFNLTLVNEQFAAVQVYTSSIDGIATIPFKKLASKKDEDGIKTLFEAISSGNKVRL